MRREAAEDAEREPDGREQSNQDEIVAGGGQRVHIALGDEEHDHQRNHETAEIELPLARLAKHDENERCVDEVIGSRHAAMIGRRSQLVVGARVEVQVDSRLNPRGLTCRVFSFLEARGVPRN